MGVSKYILIVVLLAILGGYWTYDNSSASLELQSSKSLQIEDNLESTKAVKLNSEISKEKKQPEVIVSKSQTDTLNRAPALDDKYNLTDSTAKKSWSPYIKKDSDEYNEVLKKSFNSDGPVIIGENRTFLGEEELLKSRGVNVNLLQDKKCIELMTNFIKEKPQLWNEDIGV